jgi:hypothetical protein
MDSVILQTAIGLVFTSLAATLASGSATASRTKPLETSRGPGVARIGWRGEQSPRAEEPNKAGSAHP